MVQTAPPFALTDTHGRVHRLDVWTAEGPTLLAFVERDCPTSRRTVEGLAGAGGRTLVVSEGPPAAARDVGVSDGRLPVLVETAPYPVSAAYGLQTVPTLVLVDADGVERGRCEGWDREAIGALVTAVGGDREALEQVPLGELKPGCQALNTLEGAVDAGDAEFTAAAEYDAVEETWRRGWTDGLPVVPPTRQRVDEMLQGRDAAESLGPIPPAMGELTLERLAACAVMAGCLPAYFPVVRAAVEAALDPAFNLHGVQNSTHFASPVVVVNGPARRTLGMNPSMNALGSGNRANATIGRALRLVMALTGGGTPGGLDRSTLGGPHKFGLAVPEYEEESPWPGLHTERGYAASDSTVTVFAGESPAGVADHQSATAEQLVATLGQALGSAYSPLRYPWDRQVLFIVAPEHATKLAATGWDKAKLREQLIAHSGKSAGWLRATGSGELGPGVQADTPDDEVIVKLTDPEQLLIIVAGGLAGGHSAVMSSWPRDSSAVTRPVDLDT